MLNVLIPLHGLSVAKRYTSQTVSKHWKDGLPKTPDRQATPRHESKAKSAHLELELGLSLAIMPLIAATTLARLQGSATTPLGPLTPTDRIQQRGFVSVYSILQCFSVRLVSLISIINILIK